MKYLLKKANKSSMKKFCYKCRKQVAEKRLRIKGRFVTRQQAYEILGITHDELKSNQIIQRLLESHAAYLDGDASGLHMFQLNSLVESEGGRKQIKIRNFQALIDDNYNHNSKTLDSLVPEELLRHLQLNLRISTQNNNATATSDGNTSGGTSVTKVMISGDSQANSFMMGQPGSIDENLKMSLNNLRLEGYVQPLFKVERPIDHKKI